ncbi:hypothetical protein CIC12_03660 [Burkholderia sp. SG-MS1]|nr:hypothetical protein [Paraburkholderia sp. SG-MS1]
MDDLLVTSHELERYIGDLQRHMEALRAKYGTPLMQDDTEQITARLMADLKRVSALPSAGAQQNGQQQDQSSSAEPGPPALVGNEPLDASEQATSGPPAVAPTQALPDESRIYKPNSKRHALSHIINMAKNLAIDKGDYQVVWAEMVRLASLPQPPAPLIGYAEGEIKYNGPQGLAFYTKNALRNHMARSAR